MKKYKKKSLQKKKPITKPFSFLQRLNQPILLHSRFLHYGNAFGYAFSIVGIALISGFILTGFMKRPVLQDNNVIQKIVNKSVGKSYLAPGHDYSQSNHILLLSNQAFIYIDDSEKPLGFVFTTDANSPSGILIPMEYIDISEGIEKISISFDLMYVGKPTIRWGFQTEAHNKEVITVDSFFPNHHDGNMSITTTGIVISKNSFSVSWDESDYFLLMINSKIKTETLISKITIMGYYQ